MPSLFKRSNGIYYAVISETDGHRRWISTGKRIKSQAIQVVAEQTLRPTERVPSKPLDEFFREFLNYARTVYSHESLQIYQRAFHSFTRHIGNVRLDTISPRQVDLFKSRRLGEVKAVTVNLELRTLRAAFYTAVRWKLLTENPFKQVKQCSVAEEPPCYFSVQEFQSLLSVVQQDWLRDLLVLAINAGLRRGELIQLRWADVDLTNRTIIIRSHGVLRTKCGKARVVPLNRAATEAIQRRSDRSSGGFVFQVKSQPIDGRHLSRVFKRCVRKAHLDERLHLHSVRHSFASWLTQKHIAASHIQKLLGHSNLRVTEIYSHLRPSDLHTTVEQLEEA